MAQTILIKTMLTYWQYFHNQNVQNVKFPNPITDINELAILHYTPWPIYFNL